MANIIASGTSESSVEITLTAGVPTVVFLNAASGVPEDARAAIHQKAVSGAYTPLGELSRATPALTIFGAGTVRVTRRACAAAVAVDRD